ncbi:MAG: hypothetical protein A3K19_18475 [Lentisphaerae bacterium RIFOXYB12_FULL_65_16]|nr:MAG: hypothetical protein A3K18_13810 [Lentisphaerae bacterium RIFOXYA12_64_32]OGV92948.1 MAG: hypothetical protein A3K19_18475 [Lentisphaerae bacterium RIFOXYB12_FULL_65_16]
MAKRGDIMERSEGQDETAQQPDWLKKRLEWFMDLRFGLFLHWGPYSQWDCCESWPLVPADTWARPDQLKCWTERGKDLKRFSADYRNLNRTFNPTRFAPDVWAELAESAGMKYITFTTKHHDGFCMFDTATTDYRVTHADCPFHSNRRANIFHEVVDAFRSRGLAISCYFSKSDWHSPYYWSPDTPPVDRNPNYDTRKRPELWAKFVDFVHRQVEELMTGYGKIDVLWLDGGQVRPPLQDIQMDKLAAMARTHQPGLLIADRTVGGAHENIVTPEQQIPEKPLGVPWESCMTLGQHWKYVPNDTYKPARQVIHMLAETTSKGGNLLLGVGPTPEGTIPAEAAERLTDIGRWLRTNGEAIYGSRPVAPYQAGAVRFTAKGRYVYAIILAQEGEILPPREISIPGFRPKAGSEAALLGTSAPIKWRDEENGVRLIIPAGLTAGRHAWVVRFGPKQSTTGRRPGRH